MTCQQCEQSLADAIRTPAIETHLESCPECRALSLEFEDNTQALHAMRDDFIPVGQKPQPRWLWAAAAAAILIALTVSLYRPNLPTPAAPLLPEPLASAGGFPVPATTEIQRPAIEQPPPPPTPHHTIRVAAPIPEPPSEALFVQILTPDPDVVIYWLFEPKEGIL